jgi:hypothetical protein
MTFPRAALISIAFAVLAASPASAQTAIFTDDAEAEPAAKWVVGTPPDSVEPWQKSDSSTTKFRGNQAHGGSTSYWSGMQPTNWPLVPTTAGPGTIVEGESTLTIKESFIVPANGDTNVKYWSLFQNEGDDSGALEVAVDTGGKLTWKKVKSETAVNTGAGDTDPRACDPSQPATSEVPFEEQTGSLAAFKGAKVLIRFNLIYGAENRPVSHPCGWYLDDIRVLTTGTPGAAGPPTPPAGTPAPAAARPKVKFGRLKASGKKATLSLTVSDAAISGATVTLHKGSKKVGTGKASLLAVGARKVKLKLSKKLKKGTYKVKLAGKAPDNSAFAASGATKL